MVAKNNYSVKTEKKKLGHFSVLFVCLRGGEAYYVGRV